MGLNDEFLVKLANEIVTELTDLYEACAQKGYPWVSFAPTVKKAVQVIERQEDEIERLQALTQSTFMYLTIDQLRAALIQAREDMDGWAAYASEYFRIKWDLVGDLAAIDRALGVKP